MPPDYKYLQQWAKYMREQGHDIKGNQKKSALMKAWRKFISEPIIADRREMAAMGHWEEMREAGPKIEGQSKKYIEKHGTQRRKVRPPLNLNLPGTLPLAGAQPFTPKVDIGGIQGTKRIYPGSPYSSAFAEARQVGMAGGGAAGAIGPAGVAGQNTWNWKDPRRIMYGPGSAYTVPVTGKELAVTPPRRQPLPIDKSMVLAKDVTHFETNPNLGKKPPKPPLGKWAQFGKIAGPAANTLFLGLMLYDISRRMGGFGASSEAQKNALAIMQGGLVPAMQQKAAMGADMSRMQLGVDEMDRLGNFSRQKQQGMQQAQNFMSEELDNIVALKKSRLARASLMHPDVQHHLANLVSTGSL